MRRVLGIALLYGAGAAAAGGADPWQRVQSTNFDLYTDGSEASARTIIRYFERVHSFFEKAGFGGSGNPVCLIAFRSEKEYRPYSPNAVAAAYYQPGQYRDYIVSDTDQMTEHPETVVHEYTHLMLNQMKHEIPVWLNEGLAELYSNMQPQGKKVLVGSPIAGRLQSLINEQWISLDKLISADHDSPLYNEKDRAGIFYAESWLLTHMVFLEKWYRPHYHDLVANLQAGFLPRDAFEKAFAKPLPEVEKDLRRYIQRNTVPALLFDVDLPKSSEAPTVQPGASMGARLMMAGVLSERRDKAEAAKAAFQEVERDFPDRWEVERGWAEYYRRENEPVEAAKHYAKAVELGCKDVRSLMDYATILGLTGGHKEAVAVLQRVVEAEPRDKEAHIELGSAMVRAGLYGGGIVEFNSIKQVDPPQAWRYFYYSGYALYRLGDLEQAQKTADRASQYASEPQEQRAVGDLLLDINRQRQAKAASAAAAERVKAIPVPAATAVPPATILGPGMDGPPILRRTTPRPDPSEIPERRLGPKLALPVAEGPLRSVDCQGKSAVLHLGTGGGERLFLIDDPKNVLILSGDGSQVEFQCGLQKDRPVKITYAAAPEDSPQYAGVVRGLEFR